MDQERGKFVTQREHDAAGPERREQISKMPRLALNEKLAIRGVAFEVTRIKPNSGVVWLKMVQRVTALALLVGASACTSKYSVSPKTDAANNEFALSGQPLISVTPKGRFIWRKKPEEVAVMLMTYAGNLEHNLKLCQEKLPKAKVPAK